ncbi:hypothetical protein TIFTF001_022576 [Ficus carica]|uniref:Ubiquitin-like protease family profile domain-containing protein n=1 Tax=Ficus carica TaxID=3494 RepID=A0AA88AI22_FICCA|nr:hypothetical protein TIFTF001_022576 [Ficus carica]
MPLEADKEMFYSLYHDGYRARNRKKKWIGNKDVLIPPFNFKVDYVDSKYWFHDLICSDKCFTDSHLNVAFYYLKKMRRCYPLDEFLSCLPVDAVFDTYIRDLWLYHKDWSLKDADILLIPMFMRKAKHWILGYVECKYMTLSIYNSFASHTYEEELKDLANGMATILPHLLQSVGFFDERPSNYFDNQLKLLAPMETMFPTHPNSATG